MKRLITFTFIMMFFISNNVAAVEVVYSMNNLNNCTDVGEYKASIKMNASKDKIEKKLINKGSKDNATHVFVLEYVDSTAEGKGIRVKASGKVCS